MPKVGNKKFPYTAKGKKDAKAAKEKQLPPWLKKGKKSK